MTPHIQTQLLSQAVAQCKLKSVTWFRQLPRKPHCFSAETFHVQYYLDRKAAGGRRMLICTTFHKHHKDSFTIHQMSYKPSVDIAERCLNKMHLSLKPVTDHSVLGRPWAQTQQEHQLSKEGKQSSDFTNIVQDNWAMESFTHQVSGLLPTRKTGETALRNGL